MKDVLFFSKEDLEEDYILLANYNLKELDSRTTSFLSKIMIIENDRFKVLRLVLRRLSCLSIGSVKIE